MVHAEYRVNFRDFLDSMKTYRKVAKGAAFMYYFDVWIVPLLGLLAALFALATYLQQEERVWSDWSWLCYLGIALMIVTP